MSFNHEPEQGERISVHVDSELENVIPGFIEAWKEEIRSMREALERGDYEPIRKLGHNMKGAGGACGFDAVTDAGRGLEQAAKDKSPQEIRKNLDALSSYLERVDIVYE